MNRTLNVIAFTFGEEPLSALRVRAPLMALFEAGEIASFCVVYGDGTLAGPHYPDSFNSILIMRDCHPSLSEVLTRHDLPYLYDLDDLLLIKPAYSEGDTAGDIEAIARRAELISFASPVLAQKFRKYSRLDPSAATTVIPNGLFLPPSPREVQKPTAVAWTSADRVSLSASRNAIYSAISTFCRETGLPLYLFGRVDDGLLSRVPEKRLFAKTDFSAHKLLLATHPGLIGVAPLETRGDKATLDFVNSKSDIKMVEFGGYGHGAVYSAADGYATSTLHTGVITENSREAWLEALHRCYRDAGADGHVNQHAILRERDIRAVARRHWLPALEAVSMSTAFPLAQLRRDLIAAERARGEKVRERELARARRQAVAPRRTVRLRRVHRQVAASDGSTVSIRPSAIALHAGPDGGPPVVTRLTYALDPEWIGPGFLSLPSALHDQFIGLTVYFRHQVSGRLLASHCTEHREAGEWVEYVLASPPESSIWELHLSYEQQMDQPPTLRIHQLHAGDKSAPAATSELAPAEEWLSLFTRYRDAPRSAGRFAIVVRGAGLDLHNTLHSILSQTHEDLRVYCPDSVPIALPANEGKVLWHAPPEIQDVEEDYLCLLQAGDRLHRHALSIFAERFSRFDYVLLYADHVEPDALGRRLVFKAALDLDQLLTRNCIGRPTVFRTRDAKCHPVPGRPEDEGFSHALALAMIPHVASGRIGNLSQVLCELVDYERIDPRITYRVCRDAATRLKRNIQVLLDGNRVRLQYPIEDPPPEVTILVPTRNRSELLEDCIDSVRTRTNYPAYRILVLDNDSDDPATLDYLAQLAHLNDVEVLTVPGPFNFSAIMNRGAQHTDSPLLVFLNNDTEVIARDWLRELVSHAVRSKVGVVGARLLYPDGSLQHGGIAIGVHGACGHVYRHLRDARRQVELPVDALRNVSAVTGACMAVRRDIFAKVGGFDEEQFPVSFNDLDLCLRIREHGYRVIYTPWASLYHYESATIGVEDHIRSQQFKDQYERFQERWRGLLESDPYFSPNLSLESEQCLPAFPPRTESVSDPRTRIARDYIDGVGIEIGALHSPLKIPFRAKAFYLDRADSDGLRRHYPELAKYPFVRPSVIDNGETLGCIAEESCDFVIANHFLEHAEDPIGTMKNFHRVLKPGGIAYLAIPDGRFTFDHRRPLTNWNHLYQDHRDGPEISRLMHYQEWAELVDELTGEAAIERIKTLMNMSYSIHFHVWTFQSFSQFLERLFREHLPDVELIHSSQEGAEGIFICHKCKR